MTDDLNAWRRRRVREDLDHGVEYAVQVEAGTMAEPVPHPTTHIRHGDHEADVDEELAPLIVELWKAGLVTMSSCQETLDGRAHIEFEGPDAERFLSMVADYSDDVESIYNRITVWNEPEDWQTFRADRMWHIAAVARDYGAHLEQDVDGEWRTSRDGPVDFILQVGVMFPRSDIGEVTDQMRRFNQHGQGSG